MLSLFSSLKGAFKRHDVKIDNTIFVLHYRATFLLLIAFCLAVSSNQYIGDPIHCTQPSEQVPKDVINAYCWIHATFTLPKAHGRVIDVDVAHPGVDKTNPGDRKTIHAYYQWVAFVLIMQATMFYVPRWLWKSWEGGRLINLKMDLHMPVMDHEAKSNKEDRLAVYFAQNMGNHTLYAVKFLMCEILNFANVIGQIYFVNKFLGGEFTTYGIRVVEYVNSDSETRSDPMMEVFPRVTKCTFRNFGPSGDIQRLDSLCVLPINIINEKIYVFMWFWFVVLAIVSGLVVVFRIIEFLVPSVRFTLLLKLQSRKLSSDRLQETLDAGGFGDWFILYLLASNVDPMNFKDLVDKIHYKLKGYQKQDTEIDGAKEELLRNESETDSATKKRLEADL